MSILTISLVPNELTRYGTSGVSVCLKAKVIFFWLNFH